MANRAYVSAWAKEYSEDTRLERFERLLETVPFSKSAPGFTELLVRALDISETPLREFDLRSQQVQAKEIIELVREHASPDVAFEVNALWDLWTYDLAEHRWKRTVRLLFHVRHQFRPDKTRGDAQLMMDAVGTRKHVTQLDSRRDVAIRVIAER